MIGICIIRYNTLINLSILDNAPPKKKVNTDDITKATINIVFTFFAESYAAYAKRSL